MTTTIENTCKHPRLLMIGNKEDGKEGFMKIGNCSDCDSIRVINEKYRHVSADVYVLRDTEINAKECRE